MDVATSSNHDTVARQTWSWFLIALFKAVLFHTVLLSLAWLLCRRRVNGVFVIVVVVAFIDRCFISILLYWSIVISFDESKQKHPSIEVKNINEGVCAPSNPSFSPTLFALPTMNRTIINGHI